MTDEHNVLFSHKPCEQKIAGRKIGMPPLNHHQIRFSASDIARRLYNVEGIRRVEQVLRALYFEAVIAVIPLLLVKKEFRVLHLIGNHFHIVPFCQFAVHKSRVVGDSAFVRVYWADEDDFFTSIHHIFAILYILIYSENITLHITCKY